MDIVSITETRKFKSGRLKFFLKKLKQQVSAIEKAIEQSGN